MMMEPNFTNKSQLKLNIGVLGHQIVVSLFGVHYTIVPHIQLRQIVQIATDHNINKSIHKHIVI